MKYILIPVFVLFSYWYCVMSISIEYMRKGNKYGWKMIVAQLQGERSKYDSLKVINLPLLGEIR